MSESRSLVIVESPAKAKTINKILGREFVVRASMGHVRDLPEKRLGVDIEHGFRPEYVPLKDRTRHLRELREAAKGVDRIYLAPDPDREGEAIAWHLQASLEGAVPPDRFHRITYNEITASAIRRAVEHPGAIDMNRVNSQQARRVLDRIVGYKVSPLLWRRIRGASSAGRVQSAALRLVCDRERQIREFTPEEYWILGARVAKQVDPRDPFVVRLVKIGEAKADVKTAEQAEQVRRDLDDRALRVTALGRREVTRRPQPPYITSTLQQAGSRLCGFDPRRTMRIAQTLYEGVDLGQGPAGLITYMRTDSVSVAAEAQTAARAFIGEEYGRAYVPEQPNVYRSRASAQEAHEAIRPTDIRRTPEAVAAFLKADELKVYRIIWQRFVASQMAPAVLAIRAAEVEAVAPAADATAYLFRATASEVVFPGYMKVTGIEKRKTDEAANGEDEAVDQLPPLVEGERLDRLDWLADQKFTQPPPRYSDATLVKAMEEYGIGRPSTYAQTVATLYDRKYIEREKRTLRPTALGERANEFLFAHLNELFDVKFTARMEEELDEVEEGKVEWTAMLADFYGKFSEWMARSRGPAASNPDEVKRVIDLLAGVKEWDPEQKRGKRTYSDEAFVQSIRRQMAGGERPLTQRQADAVKKLAARYAERVPELKAEAEALGLHAAAAQHRQASVPPTESMRARLGAREVRSAARGARAHL